jgi:hypothetical protein
MFLANNIPVNNIKNSNGCLIVSINWSSKVVLVLVAIFLKKGIIAFPKIIFSNKKNENTIIAYIILLSIITAIIS